MAQDSHEQTRLLPDREDVPDHVPEIPGDPDTQEKWNDPPINVWRVLAAYYSFIVVGANDGAYGVSRKSMRELSVLTHRSRH